MKNKNKKIGIFVLLAFLSLSNSVLANDSIDFTTSDDFSIEKIKANKETISKAQEAINNKDFSSAINLLTGYINEKQKKYEVYKLRGDAYYALRRYDMAEKDYQTAINLKTSDDKFMTGTKYVSAIVLGADKNEQLQNAELGELYSALMYAQKAQNKSDYKTSYENALKYNSHIYLPQPNKYEINKINCPQKYGKIINPQGIDEKIYGAITDIENNNFNEALYKLQTVTSKYPSYYLGYYLTGVALSELEKDDDAIHSFEKAISLNPYDFESYASLGQIYYSKAETTFSDYDAKKSIEYFNKALELNRNCPTYYFYIGMNELQAGNTNVAILNFDKALKINPSDYNSMYYKLIAQYINGNYQDVVSGASNLLLKHVSNHNSVLYLRALAYTKLNQNDLALEDLNAIENNIEDIFNSDIKQTSSREKSLESYTHYLKSEIQHSKGAGAASDNAIAYSNPIINRLANAKKAMEPYEKSLQNDSISLSDYNKFESFYSTSLPKLLESGAIITYDDIDNQYDYIRTTFADLGISFIYTNPDYKITTIKDYPYKKYSSKLSDDEHGSLSLRPASSVQNVALAKTETEKMRQSTPQNEMLVQSGQLSLAQMLALNELSAQNKNSKQQSVDASNIISSKENNIDFKPEIPDAERINTSKNIASGEIYESNNPPINSQNTDNLKTILEEEKNIDDAPFIRQPDTKQNVETFTDGSLKISAKNILPVEDTAISVKTSEPKVIDNVNEKISDADKKSMIFTANEIKPTENIEIKYKDIKPVTTIAAVSPSTNAVNELTNKAKTVSDDTQESIKQIKNKEQEAAKLAKLEAKNQLAQEKAQAIQLKQEAKEQIKAQKAAAKQAKLEAKEQIKAQKAEAKQLAEEAKLEAKKQLELQKAETKQLAKEAEEQAKKEKIAAKQAKLEMKNQINEAGKAAAGTVSSSANIKKQSTTVAEKHANINSTDYVQNTPSGSVVVENANDVVELKTDKTSKQISMSDSDLFTKDTVFAKPQTSDITPSVYISQETSQDKKVVSAPQSVEKKSVEPDYKQEVIEVANVNVPEITVPASQTDNRISAENMSVNQPINQDERYTVYYEDYQNSDVDKRFVKEQLSRVLNEIVPANVNYENNSEVNVNVNANESSLEQTKKETKNIKEERLRLKQEDKLSKQQKKAELKKIKENYKLQKQQTKTMIAKHKSEIETKEDIEKAKIKEEKIKLERENKLKKVFEEEQLKLEKAQNQSSEESKTTFLSKLKGSRLKKMSIEEKVAKEQEKTLKANEEAKIQRLKARWTEANHEVLSKEEKAALDEKYKADKLAAKERYKARQDAKKALLKEQKEREKAQKAANNKKTTEKKSSVKEIFSKMKFWNKNK